MWMIIYSQTHTPRDKQKHNQNNNRQKYKFGDDVNPKGTTRYELNWNFER